ncbi:hypothetical protein B0J18DRAFT_47973 [Chaetomium sp. MPI-SDFR-AT-0129]|nr:hypothetical protein B0J18DRAFT_47973 [Chaetomium sp. MPI-SDFR-AT-0129]
MRVTCPPCPTLMLVGLSRENWLGRGPRNTHTFVFLSTHSKHDKVGLFRFCFFLGWSAAAVGEAVLLSRSSGEVPRPGLAPCPLRLVGSVLATTTVAAAEGPELLFGPHNPDLSSPTSTSPRVTRFGARRGGAASPLPIPPMPLPKPTSPPTSAPVSNCRSGCGSWGWCCCR